MTPGQRVLYRVRSYHVGAKRRRSCEYVIFGVGTVRAKLSPLSGRDVYRVERDDGTEVIFGGMGLYEHELQVLS